MIVGPSSSASATAHADDRFHDQTHELVGDQEEDGRQSGHDEDHHGGDQRLAPRRPSDLLALGTHLLQKLRRAGFCHATSHRDSPPNLEG